MNIKLRDACKADAPTLLAIERQSFARPHWPAKNFFDYQCTVAEAEGKIAGFIVVRKTFDGDARAASEWEILNVAVAPEFRRLGIASLLLRNAFRSGAVYFLEVRESNIAAQSLYRNLGFTEIGRRKEYYAHPSETAIVMQMK